MIQTLAEDQTHSDQARYQSPTEHGDVPADGRARERADRDDPIARSSALPRASRGRRSLRLPRRARGTARWPTEDPAGRVDRPSPAAGRAGAEGPTGPIGAGCATRARRVGRGPDPPPRVARKT